MMAERNQLTELEKCREKVRVPDAFDTCGNVFVSYLPRNGAREAESKFRSDLRDPMDRNVKRMLSSWEYVTEYLMQKNRAHESVGERQIEFLN